MDETPKKHAGGRPVKYETPEQMQTAIDAYFNSRINEEKPITFQGLATALGLSRQGLLEYNNKDQFSDIVQKARAQVQDNVEKMLFTGQPAAGPIFWLKNNAGYADKQEIAHTGAAGQPLTVIVHRGADQRQIEDVVPEAEMIEESDAWEAATAYFGRSGIGEYAANTDRYFSCDTDRIFTKDEH